LDIIREYHADDVYRQINQETDFYIYVCVFDNTLEIITSPQQSFKVVCKDTSEHGVRTLLENIYQDRFQKLTVFIERYFKTDTMDVDIKNKESYQSDSSRGMLIDNENKVHDSEGVVYYSEELGCVEDRIYSTRSVSETKDKLIFKVPLINTVFTILDYVGDALRKKYCFRDKANDIVKWEGYETKTTVVVNIMLVGQVSTIFIQQFINYGEFNDEFIDPSAVGEYQPLLMAFENLENYPLDGLLPKSHRTIFMLTDCVGDNIQLDKVQELLMNRIQTQQPFFKTYPKQEINSNVFLACRNLAEPADSSGESDSSSDSDNDIPVQG
jgi:hypothetical protein